jgi:hypothetical protein
LFFGAENNSLDGKFIFNWHRIDPLTLKSVTRLAQEVIEAIDADPMYGPSHDRERSEVGVEYEKRLEQILTAMSKFPTTRKQVKLFLLSLTFAQTFHSRARFSCENEGRLVPPTSCYHARWASVFRKRMKATTDGK